MEKVKTCGGIEVKLQNQVKALSSKVKSGSSLLCAELEKFGKKPDKKSATGIDKKTWDLIYALAEVKELVAFKVPTVKRGVFDKPVVEIKPPVIERVWWVRADKMDKMLLRAIKGYHKTRYQEMMAEINKYGPGRVTIGYDENLRPVRYMLDF
jgi:hypothetical protein